MTVVDLGAAPGSWSQVLRERLGPDARGSSPSMYLPMDPIAGVMFVQADFRDRRGLGAVREALAGRSRSTLCSRTWPPILSGIERRRPGAQRPSWPNWPSNLRCQASAGPAATSLVKVFQGTGFAGAATGDSAARFAKVYVRKPKSSRDRSRETFLGRQRVAGG